MRFGAPNSEHPVSVIKRLIGRDPEPWSVGPPLFRFLADGVPDPDCVLPDAERQERFSLSGMDRHALLQEVRNALSVSPVEPTSPTYESVRASLTELLRSEGGSSARAAVYGLVRKRIAPPIMLSLYDDLREGRLGPPERVRAEGQWLLHNASHREGLWFATAMLTACGQSEDVDDLVVLMRHSAFQVGAIRAAAACIGDPMAAWGSLSDRAGFLGRLNLIKLLIEHAAHRPDLQAWLLRNAVRECEMPALVARDTAVAADLAAALGADIVDAALIDGACDLIDTMLVQEHSNDGISDGRLRDYPDALDAVERLLRHLTDKTTGLARLNTVVAIKDWLHGLQMTTESDAGPDSGGDAAPDHKQDDLFGWAAGESAPSEPTAGDPDPEDTPPSVNPRLGHGAWAQRGLTPDRRRKLFVECERIVSAPRWPAEIRRLHAEGDPEDRQRAWQLADRYRLDLWDATFRRLEENPLDPCLYRDLCDTRYARRIELVLAIAQSALPLIRIGAGAANEAGDVQAPGPAADARPQADPAADCLAILLKAMDQHRLMSPPLVKAALYSPSTRHRLGAVRVLSRHPWWQWGDDVQEALRDCLAREPDESIRETIYRAAVPGEDGGNRLGPRSLQKAGPLGMIQPFNGGRRSWMSAFRRSSGGTDLR